MSPSRIDDQPPITVTPEEQALRTSAGVLIAVLALGGLATQAVAITTGRDFVFGLIPGLNPYGTRNLPVWFASVTLGASALTAGLAGIAQSPSRRDWWLLAGILGLLSISRIAHLDRFLALENAPLLTVLWWTAFAGAGVASLVRCALRMPAGPRRRLLVASAVFTSGAVACATARPMSAVTPTERLAVTVVMTSGRVLELSGLIMFLETVVASLGTIGPALLVHVTPVGPMPPPADGARVLCVRPAAVSRTIGGIIVTLLTANLVAKWARLQWGAAAEPFYRFLHVDFEGNLPTWVATFLLAGCGAVLAVIATARRQQSDSHWRWWTALSLLFFALSADEAASIHELFVRPLRSMFGGNRWVWFPLVVPGTVAALAAWATFRRFLLTLPTTTRRALYRGIALFLGGVLVLETMGGWFDPERYGDNLVYFALATAEEGLEMWGIAVMVVGLLEYLGSAIGPVYIARTDV